MTNLENHVFAFFVAEHADNFKIADRFFPYGDLILQWEDKINVATRKFGTRVRMKAKVSGTAFLDMLIEKGGYSTKTNDFGGTMHAFQLDEVRKIIAELKESDPIILKAKAGGPDFWTETFAELTKD
ncbi:MAG: hypothetical protein P8J20_13045 [Novosphingobium sp.]|nr:hypothetical protein [Novosphingobium sp.]